MTYQQYVEREVEEDNTKRNIAIGLGIFLLCIGIWYFVIREEEKTCPSGFTLVDGKCVKDVLTCPSGSKVVDGKCVKEFVVGSSCTSNPNSISKVDENGKCKIVKCNNGYTYDLSSGNCVEIICKSGYTLTDDYSCIKDCPAGEIPAGDKCILDDCPKGTVRNLQKKCVDPVSNPAYFCAKGTAINPETGLCHKVLPELYAQTSADKKLSFNNLNSDVCVPWRVDADNNQLFKRVNSTVRNTGLNIYDLAKRGDLRFKLPKDGSVNYFLDEFSGPVFYKSTDDRPRWFGKLPLAECGNAPTKYIVENQ